MQSNFKNKDNILANVTSLIYRRGYNSKEDDGRNLMKDTIILVKNDYQLFLSGGDSSWNFISKEDSLSYLQLNEDSIISVAKGEKRICFSSKQDEIEDHDYLNFTSEFANYSCVFGKDNADNPIYYNDTIINGENYYVFSKIIDLVKQYEEFMEAYNLTLFGYFPQIIKASYYVNKETKLVELVVNEVTNFSTEMLGDDIRREYRFSYSFPNKENAKKYLNRFNPNDKEFKNYTCFNINDKEDKLGEVGKEGSVLDSIFKEWNNRETQLSQNSLNAIYKDFEGNSISLKDVDGWILIDGWFLSCNGCAFLMTELQKKNEELTEQGIRIISLNPVEKPSEYMKAFLKKIELNLDDLYFFQEKELLPNIFPSLILINPDKKIVYKKMANINLDEVLVDINKIIDEYYGKR